MEPGETLPQALVRECREELGVTIQVGSQFNQVVHEYPDMRIRLTLFHCQIPLGIPPLALEHKDLRWVHPSKLSEYSFCPADKTIAEELIRVYGDKEPL